MNRVNKVYVDHNSTPQVQVQEIRVGYERTKNSIAVANRKQPNDESTVSMPRHSFTYGDTYIHMTLLNTKRAI